jgi:hypothetical protein
MNTISKTHKRFSEILNIPRVLENPEEFLGPNFESVLNFWLILDDLSKEQWRVVNERHKAFYNENYLEWDEAKDLAWDASEEVVGWRYADEAAEATYNVTNSWLDACFATRELIGMHKILENHKQLLTFFQMFLEVFI